MARSPRPVPFDRLAACRIVRRTMGLEASGKYLLLMLLTYADERGESYPSLRDLAADTGLDLSSIKRHKAKLVQLGVLQQTPRVSSYPEGQGALSNLYRIDLNALVALGQRPDQDDEAPW